MTVTRAEMSLSAEYFRTAKFGKLRMKEPTDSSRGSHRKVAWLCDCGRETEVAVCTVVRGNTSSCRKCDMLTAEHMASARFGKLRMKDPADLMPGSRKKVAWLCDCGQEAMIQPLSVTSGHTSSCGKCNRMVAKDLVKRCFGKLRMSVPKDILPGSHEVVEWVCDCGNVTERPIHLVLSGHTSSCGRCNVIPATSWAESEYGFLTMESPEDLSPGSNKKVWWRCRCGGRLESNVHAVTSGRTTRCGQCQSRASDWYEANKERIRSLKTPFSATEIPSGWIVPLSDVAGYEKPFRALCGACRGEYAPMWQNVCRGKSLTCGCASNHISRTQRDIARFVEGLGFRVFTEHRVRSLKYDIFVPDGNLLIEYHGLRWHAASHSKTRDLRKYEVALDSGFDFVSLFEDEWSESRPVLENLLRNRLGKSSAASVRPSRCEFGLVGREEVFRLYEAYHYLGPCFAKVHYGVRHEGRIIAAASFGAPVRQSSHPWELLRMASDPAFRVHGVWNKIMRMFVREHSPKSVVSFSDNRLFSGRVYESIGFRLDGEVPPDYYWVKAGRRFNKSGMRKRPEERDSGLTEVGLREAEGYRRVWDLGKKRWVWTP